MSSGSPVTFPPTWPRPCANRETNRFSLPPGDLHIVRGQRRSFHPIGRDIEERRRGVDTIVWGGVATNMGGSPPPDREGGSQRDPPRLRKRGGCEGEKRWNAFSILSATETGIPASLANVGQRSTDFKTSPIMTVISESLKSNSDPTRRIWSRVGFLPSPAIVIECSPPGPLE